MCYKSKSQCITRQDCTSNSMPVSPPPPIFLSPPPPVCQTPPVNTMEMVVLMQITWNKCLDCFLLLKYGLFTEVYRFCLHKIHVKYCFLRL